MQSVHPQLLPTLRQKNNIGISLEQAVQSVDRTSSLHFAGEATFQSWAYTRPSFYLELCQECLQCEGKNMKYLMT